MRAAGRSTFQWGVLCGGLVALLGVLSAAVLLLAGRVPALSALGGYVAFAANPGVRCLFVLVILASFYLAGMLAARQTGMVGSGTLSGLIAGLLGGTIGSIANGAVLFTSATSVLPTPGHHLPGSQVFAVINAIGGILISIVLYASIGALAGALGSLAGRGKQPRVAHPQEGSNAK